MKVFDREDELGNHGVNYKSLACRLGWSGRLVETLIAEKSEENSDRRHGSVRMSCLICHFRDRHLPPASFSVGEKKILLQLRCRFHVAQASGTWEYPRPSGEGQGHPRSPR